MRNETIDALGATGSKTIAAGAGLTSFGWITSNEFLGLVGAIVAVAGLAITWYYKREANRRHAREHELRMARLRRGMETPDTDLAEQGVDE
ncbi:holin [Acidovorax sp.]|uniref:holin n=1 Tax=Acidovorax sp. TaxID=1872122 RepID=UPI002ACDA3B1|nr:holin [Acidovorax sp.]MDZ7863019.1 holin [Acidovorax sp.]